MRWRPPPWLEVAVNGVIAWSWLPAAAVVMWRPSLRESIAIVMGISLWTAWRTDMGVWVGSRVRYRQHQDAEAAGD
jgi:hypothetical protein